MTCFDIIYYMIIIACGSRDWKDVETIREFISTLPKDSTVIHGSCKGADEIAGHVSREFGMNVQEYPADWKKHGKAAGPLRNQLMLDEGNPELVVAFHDDISSSKGTKDMVARASKRKVRVEIITGKNV